MTTKGDLISREALKEAITSLYEYAELNEVLEIINNAPTVEVRDNFDIGYAEGYKDGMTGADMRGDSHGQ